MDDVVDDRRETMSGNEPMNGDAAAALGHLIRSLGEAAVELRRWGLASASASRAFRAIQAELDRLKAQVAHVPPAETQHPTGMSR
jgi:hypothetical protein